MKISAVARCAAGILVGLIAFTAALSGAEDWTQFRGPQANGLSDAKDVPRHWSRQDNIKWRAALPAPGNSSPVVSGRHVFVTCAQDQGRQRALYCFDRATGELLWVRTVAYDKVMPTHKTNPHSGSTPLATETHVVVWHGSAGVFCYDFAGNEVWSRELGEFRHIWGFGASPIRYRDRALLNCGPGERSFLIALDLATGKTLWKSDEPGGDSGSAPEGSRRGRWIGSWSSPVVVDVNGRTQVVCGMPTRVNGYDPDTGEILWTCEGLANLPRGNLVYTSPVIEGARGVVLGGFNGPALGFALGGSGNITETHRLWRIAEGNPQRIGSGVIVDGHLYIANAGPSTIQCLNVETGEELWQSRSPGGNSWGSIVAAEGRLYVTTQEGDTVVFAPNAERFEELAVNSLGEPSNSTPALADSQIFIRTFEALYCIEE